jgi:hypothetical protein
MPFLEKEKEKNEKPKTKIAVLEEVARRRNWRSVE